MAQTNVTIGEVLKAIEVLPLARQEEVITTIQKQGGITPEYAQKIAELLENQVQEEAGSAQELEEERRLLREAAGDLARGRRDEQLPAETPAESEEEIQLQQEAYEEWFAGVQDIERQAARRAEGAKRTGEEEEMARLRNMLKGEQA